MRWFRQMFSRGRRYDDLAVSIREHLEEKIDELMDEGLSREQAERAARREFGNVVLLEERSREVWQWRAVETVLADLKYALRQLTKHPGFAVTAIVTLALSIGAYVVVFGVFNALVLRTLNVSEAERLVNVVQGAQGYDNESYPDYLDYRDRNAVFSGVAAYRLGMTAFSIGTTAEKRWNYAVSGNYFDMLGVEPALGRFFHASDEHGKNSAPYIVLSHAFWRRRFSGDAKIVGRTVFLNKHPFTVIGVAPEAFHGTELFLWPDFWVPMINEEQIEGFDYLNKRFSHGIWVLGKLKPGVNRQQATDNLNAISAQLAKQFPDADDGLRARLVKPGLMGDVLGDAAKNYLTGIVLLAVLVLLAASANLAGIFAVRAADRNRELAIRLSIGSSRWHILRQLLTEAILVAVIGGAAGTMFAGLLLKMLTQWQPFAEFPIHVAVMPDVRVYAMAMLASLACGILFGLLPARQIWQTDAAQLTRAAVPGGAVTHRVTMRDLLLGVQITLCALLVTASLVALRGMLRSLHAPIGFEPRNVVLAETDMHMVGYSDDASLAVQKRMLEEIGRIPGVTAVATINETPLGTGGSSTPVYREGTSDFRASNSAFSAKFYSISPGYLRAAGTRLLGGRDITWHDDAKAPRVVLVNESFAREMFGTPSAVGRVFVTPGDKPRYEIVGVVEDGKYDSLTENLKPAMFLPVAQNTDSDTALVVRSPLPPAEVAAELTRVLNQIDPNLPFTIHSWPDALALVMFPARVATASLGVMGVLAAMLALTGVFGMAAYSVSKRMKELGIRVALGAQPMQLMRATLERPLVLLASGSIAGLALGVLATKLLAQIVYEATPGDPLVLGGVLATMAFLGLLATWIPARRALGIDPARLLRDE